MRMFSAIGRFVRKYFFNSKWRCNVCGKEIFDGEYFCPKCKDNLPLNDGSICEHCGRKTGFPESYCSTCKGVLVSIDKSRSAFTYEQPVSGFIKQIKYYGKKYLVDVLADYLAICYYKNLFCPDFIVFVPMTEKAKKKRGYNQSELLEYALSKRVNVKVVDCVAKINETTRQAKLKRNERLKNLRNAYRVLNKSIVKDKEVLIVDDVTTTGATAEALASKLKKAGARTVNLLTVASVPPIEGY